MDFVELRERVDAQMPEVPTERVSAWIVELYKTRVWDIPEEMQHEIVLRYLPRPPA